MTEPTCDGCRYYKLRRLGNALHGYEHHCYRDSGGDTLRFKQGCDTRDERPAAPPACKDREDAA